jgi:hypothetical protein
MTGAYEKNKLEKKLLMQCLKWQMNSVEMLKIPHAFALCAELITLVTLSSRIAMPVHLRREIALHRVIRAAHELVKRKNIATGQDHTAGCPTDGLGAY